jgi:hypothetical protein
MLKTSRDALTGARTITFSLPADEGAVSVVGNFNDWTPQVHVLAGRGKTRSVRVEVPGDYIAVFRYLGEGGRWFDEPEASFVDAGASVLLPAENETPSKAAKVTAKAPAVKAVARATRAKTDAPATKPAATRTTANKATKAPAAKAPVKAKPAKATSK